ncbi:IclR family transcriptional regulator [Lysinibacillus sp. PLM2]|nr:IclR family transcriptional regulator [Lysinibacillus sp. PLM2]
MNTNDTKSAVQSVDRALELLEIVASSEHSISILELIEKTGLNRTTVWRLLKTLENRGFVEKDEVTNNYRIGVKLYQLVKSNDSYSYLLKTVQPYMEKLCETYNETVILSVFQNTKMYNLYQVDPSHTVRLMNYTNTFSPLHCSSNGKLQLSYFTEEELESYLTYPLEEFSPYTITNKRALKLQLEQIRQQNYSLSIGEYDESENAISIAIEQFGKPVAFLTLGGPAFRVSEKDLRGISSQLLKVAKEISDKLK